MSLQPLWPLWLLILFGVALLALVIWNASQTRGMNRVSWIRRIAIVIVLMMIGLGPSLTDRVSDALLSNAEVYFVVDRTGSMAAEDFAGGATRLSGVSADIDELTRVIPAAQYSIIAFDSQASRQLPLTSDARAVRAWAVTMRQEVTHYSAGSAIDRPVDLLEGILYRAEERNPQNVRLVFLFSDGENTRGSASDPDSVESYSPLAQLVDGGAVLGYGTPEGGKMRLYKGTGEPEDGDWIIDAQTQEPAISRIDESQLRQVAADLGIAYAHRFDDSSLEPLVSDIDLAEVEADGRRDAVVYQGVYWIGGLILATLFVWEAWDLLRHVPNRRGVKRGMQDPLHRSATSDTHIPDSEVSSATKTAGS